jgi:ribosome maturation factor RimP
VEHTQATQAGSTGETVTTKDRQIADMLESTVKAMGFSLWGIEYNSQGRHSVLRVYIERDSGITADDCAAVSTQVSAILDVEDPITGEYSLEVSSPGMDRRLFTLDQYTAYIGEIVDLHLRSPFDGRRKFKGVLKGIEGEDIVVQIDDHEFVLPHDGIDKARVEPRV